MSLIIKEIQHTINECEESKKYMFREAERMSEERKAYQHIKNLMEVVYEENNAVRQDS